MARWATSFLGSFPASAWAWPVSAPPIRGAAKGSSNTRHQLEPTMSTTPKFGALPGQAILRTNFPAGQVPPSRGANLRGARIARWSIREAANFGAIGLEEEM